MLAIDLGSSWCKVAYLAPDGQVLAEGRAYTRAIVPALNGNLEAFWEAVASAVRAASDTSDDQPVPSAIAISCRGLFGACLDTQGNGFWPGWDYGALKTSAEVFEVYDSEIWAGKDPFAHGYAVRLAAMALWMQRKKHDEWAAISRIGALHDYIVYRLTGRWTTDPTTGPEQFTWPEELLEFAGLPVQAFPEIVEPHEVVAGLTPDAAHDLGLPSGVPVVAGFHDGTAANRGTGTIQPGDACFTLGTNFVLRAVTGQRLTSKCFCYTVAPGMWAWVNNVPNSATQLDVTAAALAGDSAGLAQLHRQLGEMARASSPAANYATIELAPVNTVERLQQQVDFLRGRDYSDGDIYRAMLESIAIGVRGLIERARSDGADPQRFVATGGSSRNGAFLEVLSSVIDASIEAGDPEAGLIGAGMAAAVGAGWYPTLDVAMECMRRPGITVYPDAEAVATYRDMYREEAVTS